MVEWFLDKDNRELLTWLGGGIVTVIGGAWTWYNAHKDTSCTPPPPSQATVVVSHSGIAFNLSGDGHHTVNITQTVDNTEVLAMLTQLVAKEHTHDMHQQLQRENQQLKAQMGQLSQQLARATANHDTSAIHAVEGLNAGSLTPTADYLRAIAQKARSEGTKKDPEAAEAMRQLASISTTAEALKALQSACDYEPDNTLNWWLLGDMHLQAGNITRAKGAYTQMLTLTQTATRSHPNDPKAQRDLSISYNKIGNIQKVQGDLSGALDYFHQALAIIERLTQRDESNVQWQQYVAEYLLDISITRSMQGDQQEAKISLKRAEGILEKLVREEKLSANRKIWEQDLRTKLEKAQSY